MPKETFFIKPAANGLIVRDPITREPLAAAGEEKPRNKYWLAREAEESVIQAKRTSVAAELPPKKKEGDQK